MTTLQWIAITLGVFALTYAIAVGALIRAGRRMHAKALLRAIPDMSVLVARLLREPAVPRRHKLALGALALYLAFPVDLVPDFIPVAGQLDDVILIAWVLRSVLRAAGPDLLRAHWPGPPVSLDVLERIAGVVRS
jgi:uncharacterized membrane protein YkvA (DUF1232 family)